MSARILIVEDDPGIRELLRVNLQHAGFTPICCDSAEAAAAELQLGTPDLIVLDWMLPGRSGVDFARELRGTTRGRDVPLLMLTARAQEGDKLQGFETGADDYMTKPFSPRELVARVRALLRRAAPETTQTPLEFAACVLSLKRCASSQTVSQSI